MTVFSSHQIKAFRLAASLFRPGPDARNSLSLVRNSSRLSRAPFRSQRSWLATSRRYSPFPLPVRPFRSATPGRLAPAESHITASGPLQSLRLARVDRESNPNSPWGLLPPAGSKRWLDWLSLGPPSEYTRFPFAPRRRYLFLALRLRINVPGPLRFRILAVPQLRTRGCSNARIAL